MSNFDRAFTIVASEEGGYVNDPNDPGGETKYGISKRQYPGEDIRGMTLDRAKELYKRDYWDIVKGDSLPWPLSALVFDAAVNQGAIPAVQMMQRALDVTQDGRIGPGTLNAAAKSGNYHYCRFMAFRTMRYQSSRNFDKYGEGWLNRCFNLMTEVSQKG